MEPIEPNNNLSTADNGKTVGIISYLTIIGWLVALLAMHNEKKTELGSYQLRQTLLLYIIGIGVYIVWMAVFTSLIFTGGFWLGVALNWVIRLGLFILWLIGFLGAVNGEKKPIPLIGEKAQTMFLGI
jgi:uncharacterized membrane protein